MKQLQIILLSSLLVATIPRLLVAQSPSASKDSSDTLVNAPVPQSQNYTYVRPSHATRLSNYAFDAFGPYPIIAAAASAGINQAGDAPPEWGGGIGGYGRRVGSNFGIAFVDTTTRYALSEALKEDTLYYRCECTGVFARLRHAVISTFTARRGEDGHRVFSLPAVVAPYAGTMTAVYGWYPNRFGAKDAFRSGNYSLLTYMGGNIGLEFIYGGPHSLLSRIHVNLPIAAPSSGTTP